MFITHLKMMMLFKRNNIFKSSKIKVKKRKIVTQLTIQLYMVMHEIKIEFNVGYIKKRSNPLNFQELISYLFS